MDEGFIFYIILAVIALVSQILKKKKPKAMPPGGSVGEGQPRPQRKPFSFDEILKELQAEALGEEPAPELLPVPEKRQVRKFMEPPKSRKPKEYETMEGMSYETNYTDDEDISEKAKKYQRDEHYSLVEKTNHPIMALLKSEDGAKNAIILSEIINRKY